MLPDNLGEIPVAAALEAAEPGAVLGGETGPGRIDAGGLAADNLIAVCRFLKDAAAVREAGGPHRGGLAPQRAAL